MDEKQRGPIMQTKLVKVQTNVSDDTHSEGVPLPQPMVRRRYVKKLRVCGTDVACNQFFYFNNIILDKHTCGARILYVLHRFEEP